MKTSTKTIAKTKKGNYAVTAEIFIDDKTGIATEKLTCIIEGVEYQLFLHAENDRVNISDDLAAKFGVKNDYNIVIQCDTFKIKNEKKVLLNKFESIKYDGSVIDSGLGFNMKNTKKNNQLCTKHGYDAIDMVS